MPYGVLKVDTVTFTSSGVDKSVTLSGLVQNPTFSGTVTSTSTISGVTIQGGTLVSGATVTGSVGQFTSLTAGTVTLTSGVFASGTAAAPSVSIGTSTNGLYSPGADQLAISTGGTGRVFVASDGKVGIGTTSPQRTLHVSTSDNVPLRLTTTNANNYIQLDNAIGLYYIASKSGNNLVFEDNSGERARIDSSGRLLVGTSTARSQAGVVANLQIEGGAYDGLSIVTNNPSGTNCPVFLMGKSRGNVLGSSVSVASGDRLGALYFQGADGTDIESSAAAIEVFVDGTPGANDMPGRLVFSTTADGNATPTERMRIDSSGRLLVGTSTAVAGSRLVIQGNSLGAGSAAVSHYCFDGATPADGDGLGYLIFGDNTQCQGAFVYAARDGGTWSGSSKPSRLVFSTTADGAATPTERLRITSDGRVGIGTSPSGILHTSASNAVNIFESPGISSVGLRFRTNNSDRWQLQVPSASADLALYTGAAASEVLRVDSSGRLLVGTSTALTGTTSQFSKNVNLGNSANTAGNAVIVIGRGGAAASLSSGNQIGSIYFTDNAAGEFASIDCFADAAPGTNDYPGRLVFSTTADGAASPTERMRIDNSGYVTIYKNTSNLARLNFESSSTRIEYSDATGHLSFYTNSSARVRINYGGSFVPVTDNSESLGASSERWTAVYAVNGTIQTSDLREKTDVATSSLGTDFIKQLRPVSYKFKVGENVVTKDEDGETDIVTPRPGERTHWGFIAQEVKEVVDAAGVDFGGWILTDKDDPDSTQGLRYDQFIAPLTKALQEALAEIDVLKAKVAALESA